MTNGLDLQTLSKGGKDFNVLSLFSGMNCDLIALQELGIKVTHSFASEIKKGAIEFTQHNFPNTVLLGDVMNWRSWRLPKIHLVTFGSPCQSFSNLNFDRFKDGVGCGLAGKKSSLFFVAFDILKHLRQENPDILFLCENVIASGVIGKFLNVEPIYTDNLEFACASRQRLWFTNIAAEKCTDVVGSVFWRKTIPDSNINKGITLDIDMNVPVDVPCMWLKPETVEKLFSHRLSSGVVFENGDRKQTGCVTRHRKLSKFGYSFVYQNGRYRYHSESELRQMHGIPSWVHFPSSSMYTIQDLIGDGWSIPSAIHILKHLPDAVRI